MLASITPLGERGRRSRWGITVGAFLIGATVAGAAEGALLGGLGRLLLGGGLPARSALLVLTGALCVAVALELLLAGVPGPRRQVNERWLDEFRGWVYGLGFGAQLGLGITTVVTSTATYVAMLAAFLSADPWRGAIVLGLFGTIRGVTPLLAARVRGPEELRAFHARFERLRRLVTPTSRVCLVGMTAAAVAGSVT